MRHLRTFFCSFSCLASSLALAHHLGFNLWGCASCSLVDELPMSAALAWGGPGILLLVAYANLVDLRAGRIALFLGALCSLTLAFWMIRNNTFCEVCFLVHVGVVSAALTLIPKPRFVGPLFFSAAIIFTSTGGWDQFLTHQGVAFFRVRDHELIPNGQVYVLFTDPECPRCQLAEAQIRKLPQPPQILYRWTLLPHTMYRSVRAATLVEMARANDSASFDRVLRQLQEAQPPLTDKVLLSAARRAGIGASAQGWLDDPSERVLIAIANDQTTSQELNIRALPALAELSSPDATGTRTLHLVPFSAIGVQP